MKGIMTEKWLFLDTGKLAPALNMALDEVLLIKESEGIFPPILRFYGWKPAGLSLGYFQKTQGKIDIAGAMERGFDIIRRPTGGLAVLHDDELTYSIIIPENHKKMSHSITQDYRVLSQGLIKGYENLGIEADLAIPEGSLRKLETSVCFEEPSWYELVINGKKAAGSAQTRQRGVILQHGSIPLTMDDMALFDLFIYPNEKVKQRARNSFKQKAVAINDVLDVPVSLEEVKHAFKLGFEQGLNIELEELTLDQNIWDEAELLAHEKYELDSYTFSR